MFRLQYAVLILLAAGLSGCGGYNASPSPPSGSGNPAFGPIGAEAPYCSTISSPTTSTTITATAQFQYWVVDPNFGLTTTATAAIRAAEVQILDSNGTIVQCGQTSLTGAVSVAIPRVAGTYTLKVLSRADNSLVRASILDNSTSMAPYQISTSFTLAGNETTKAATLNPASYTGSLEGGAFNILDQIYIANDFIRTKSTDCPTMTGVCTAFNGSISKVRVFWKPGLSPGVYYGSPTASISFFIAQDQSSLGMATGIYLMGGVNGDTCVDTDHFDNSVIIHEYGHFLEKTFAFSDSPGGSHNGNKIIDPRLAWSEGWANFLQSAVRNDSRYVDTKGNASCPGGTGINVNLDLEVIVAGQDAVSGSTYLGEGIFREVSVSRALWDTMTPKIPKPVGDAYGANTGFGAIWKVFTDTVNGFRSTNVHFRNIGLFNQFMRALLSANAPTTVTDYDNVILNERQRSDLVEYSLPLTPQAAATCTWNLQGIAGVDNYASTNDFYTYNYDGTAAHSIVNLRYAATPSGTPTDLDLYVWREAYAFSDASTLVTSSARVYPEVLGLGLETINLSGNAAGIYLIHVRADSNSVRTTAKYYLDTNGGSERLCP